MPVYWSLRSVPELSDLPRAERRRLWRRCWPQSAFRHWQTWAALLACGLSPLLGGWVGAWVGSQFGARFLGGLLGAGVGGGIGGFVVGQVGTAVLRPYLRAEREATRTTPGPDA